MVFTADSEASKLADAVNKLVATNLPDAAVTVGKALFFSTTHNPTANTLFR